MQKNLIAISCDFNKSENKLAKFLTLSNKI